LEDTPSKHHFTKHRTQCSKEFPQAQDHQAILKNYDGYDVTRLEARRLWQKNANGDLPRGTSATIKPDKLAKGVLSKTQVGSVAEGASLGARMAEARERVDKDEIDTVSGAIFESPFHPLEETPAG